MQLKRYPLTGLCICALLSACSAEDTGSPDHYFRTFEEDGITIAETSGIPKYEGNILEFVQVLEIKEDERPESLLFRPTDFIMDSDGNFHVADSGDCRIAVFDTQGRYLRDYGAKGEGPGEFQMPMLQYIENDIVHIYDFILMRMTRFRTDGVLLDVTSLPPGYQQRPDDFYLIADGQVAMTVGQSESDGDDSYEWIDVFVHTATGDTIAHMTTERVLTGYTYSGTIDGRSMTRRGTYPYAGTPMAYYSPVHGFVLSDGDRPVLDIYTTSGSHVRSIRVDLPARPVTGDDRAAIEAIYEQQLAEADERLQASLRDYRRNLRFREFKSPWFAFIMDDYGYFWLIDTNQLSVMDMALEGLEMMLLSPEGEFLGRAMVPPISFLKFSQGHFLTNVRDPETGESTLTVYEIRPTVPGLKYP
jgi:hypothetical protein